MILLSEKRDVFTQNLLGPIRREFYFQRVLFSGGITQVYICDNVLYHIYKGLIRWLKRPPLRQPFVFSYVC